MAKTDQKKWQKSQSLDPWSLQMDVNASWCPKCDREIVGGGVVVARTLKMNHKCFWEHLKDHLTQDKFAQI